MTIRYLHEGLNGTDSDCTGTALGFTKKAVLSVSDDQVTMTYGVASLADPFTHSWTTEPDNPNVEDWPSGDYVFQIEIQQDQLQHFNMHIDRLNSSCVSQGELGESGNLTGAGTHTFTVNTNPGAGAASDRFMCRTSGLNTDTMNPKNFKARVSLVDPDDSWQEGPWGDVPDEGVTFPATMMAGF